ncbi:hypothetical protein OG533_39920 (plasmid) [Streptomyces sp. NBC_01186]|uniref:hypothetical protein n=1 Tax=Streptomyces sp. NBC_01186 TaxID=2903765 RepID=UPI002E126926|nr:hypothetical protein OG533_39920 [Streptomyces sp. NBC_01186]
MATPAYAGAKPPDPVPKELKKRAGDRLIGINTDNREYCIVGADNCRWPQECEVPGQKPCPTGGKSSDERKVDEYLKKHNAKDRLSSEDYKFNKRLLLQCQKEYGTLQGCLRRFLPGKSPVEALNNWVAGKISQAASSALKEVAATIGHGVVWFSKLFAKFFNKTSVITLSETGIGPMMGIMTGISALVATFLLLIQFGKLAVTQKGAPAVTAITGLAKWGVILAFYVTATQVALNWSDTVSTALINYTFNGGDGTSADASAAMKAQLTGAFGSLVGGGGGASAGLVVAFGGGMVPAAIGFVIVIGILCLLAIAALWLEMQIRQAGIMILLITMPLALAGQIADATNEWWPKARNALIALILMKPVIVLCFCIGFSSIESSDGVGNVIVGLLIFLLACFAWPTLAKFMTFTTVGAGNSAASGMLSSIGSSVSSYFGQPTSGGGGGAGASGGGSGYTQALESENESGTEGGGSSAWNRRLMGAQHQKGAGLKPNAKAAFKAALPIAGMGMQVAAMGKDILESSAQNVAAHAGLDHAAQGGRHVITPDKDRGRASEEQAPAPAPAPTQEQEQDPSPSPQPPQPSEPPPAPQPQNPEGD